MAQTPQHLAATPAVGPTRRDPVVLRNEGQRIFGVVHRPAVGVAPCAAVAIYHGFVGSKDQPHQLYVKLAEALARAGIVALRIDFRGRGDSEGETVDITPAGDLGDATAALTYLEGLPDVDAARLGLIGHSWGGTVAALLAGRDPRVRGTVLWNPPINVREWDPPFEEIDGRQVLEVFGNLVGREFYAATRHIDPIAALVGVRGPVLVVQSGADEVVASAEFSRLKAALADNHISHDGAVIDGADHAFMHHAWERDAIAHTVAWLQQALMADATDR